MLLKRMIEGGDYFLALPQGIFANDLANLVSVGYLWMLKPMAVVFVLLEFDTTLGDGCGVWEFVQFLGNKMSPGLFRDFMDGYLKY